VAFFVPIRLASRVPEGFNADHLVTRCRTIPAAANEYVCGTLVPTPRDMTSLVLLTGLKAPWCQTNVCPNAEGFCEALRIVANTKEPLNKRIPGES
jgi:hypothetical protein